MKHSKKQSSIKPESGNLIKHTTRESVRLNKYISDSGFCSRREADKLIEGGKVFVDGKLAMVGTKVGANQQVKVNGKIIKQNKNLVYIALNKPVGVICTTDLEVKDNIATFMDYPEMIFPIGRLDRESKGLILLTNDGDIVNKILREEYGHDKEYFVRVDKKIDKKFLESMAKGVKIFNPVTNQQQKTNTCKVTSVGTDCFRIILNQGLNRQIRRMTEVLGYNVTELCRMRVMNIHLGDLKEGEWRYLTKKELIELNSSIQRASKRKS